MKLFLFQILIALAFYATGSYQTLIGQSVFHNVSQTTVSRAVRQVTEALNHSTIYNKYIIWPLQCQERNAIKAKLVLIISLLLSNHFNLFCLVGIPT